MPKGKVGGGNLGKKKEKGLSEQQKRFCERYQLSFNATLAAKEAGYSADSARTTASRLLKKANVQTYLTQLREDVRAEEIATEQEVLKKLTATMNGATNTEVVVVEGVGDGRSKARIVEKKPDERDQLKAAELLGKHLGLFQGSASVSIKTPVVILDDLSDFLDDKPTASNKLVTKE